MSHPSEKLAIFGKNRYHDWMIIFFTTVFLVLLAVVYNFSLYTSTNQLVSDTKINPPPSQFDKFKNNVDKLSVYLNTDISTATTSVPRDPSIR